MGIETAGQMFKTYADTQLGVLTQVFKSERVMTRVNNMLDMFHSVCSPLAPRGVHVEVVASF